MSVSRQTIAAIRFGYGFHPDQAPPGGAEDLLSDLETAARAQPLFEFEPLDARAAAIRSALDARKMDRASDKTRNKRRAMRRATARDGLKGLFQRAVSPNGLFERLTAFWLDHFSVGLKNAVHGRVMAPFEYDAIRANLMGRFADMLTAVAQHPAMLFYLDQGASVGPSSRAGKRRGRGLNENLAREILELHTIGVEGPYTQTDVREFAELLTGYGLRVRDAAFTFRPERAEPGAETVLGQSYGGDPARPEHAVALFEDLAAHPATARHMAHKLAVHFVADTPDDDLVNHIESAWRSSGGALPRIYEALVEHPASWRDFGAKVKQPQDLVISTLRSTGLTQRTASQIERPVATALAQALKAMNQQIYRPPGPQGWPEEAQAWITPQGLAARLDFAGKISRRIVREQQDLDPRRFAQTALRDALRPETAFAVGGAAEKWEGLALVLASPEFNRR